MKRVLLSLIVLLATGVVWGGITSAAPKPEYRLGFKALAERIPDIVGEPLDDEHHNPHNGDSLQQTSKGLMAWRKHDNWTAFTNGSRTWINGPHGVQERANDQRFDWEAVESTPTAATPVPMAIPAGAVEARVSRVVSSDTIEVEIGGVVRTVSYIGVNAPEAANPDRPSQAFGSEALARNVELVDGQTVYLEKDVTDSEKDGTLPRYVYLADGRMVNLELVRGGYAHTRTSPPDVKYRDLLRAAEKEAQEARGGPEGRDQRRDEAPEATVAPTVGPLSSTTPGVPTTQPGATATPRSPTATPRATSPAATSTPVPRARSASTPVPSPTACQTSAGGGAEGEWVTSSYRTARYYYHRSDSRWKGLSPQYRVWFATREELLARFPDRSPAP